jgi:2-octaprenyl-6-methoxyphenol hydroxylase
VPGAIAIRGAGPVGCVLALALNAAGRKVTLIGTRPPPDGQPQRPIALSHASRLILERVAAWPALSPSPIRTVHVSQSGTFGRTRLEAADAGVPALGYVVDYSSMLVALHGALDAQGIAIAAGCAEDAALDVHAEGMSDAAEEKDYGKAAVVALVTAEPASRDTAWERFTPEGPLALLPLAGKYGLVWSTTPEQARALCAVPAAEFLAALANAFGRRAGKFKDVQARSVTPLTLRTRPSRIGAREAFVGNAAQALHPVAGQGLNLGLRDAWDLAQVLGDAEDPGAPDVLQRFAALRRLDAAAAVRVTDWLAGGFLGEHPLLAPARGLALAALDLCAPARRFFARRMIFGPSALP